MKQARANWHGLRQETLLSNFKKAKRAPPSCITTIVQTLRHSNLSSPSLNPSLRSLEGLNLEARCKALAPKKSRAEGKAKPKPNPKKASKAKAKAKVAVEEEEEEEEEEEPCASPPAPKVKGKPKAPATRKNGKTAP